MEPGPAHGRLLGIALQPSHTTNPGWKLGAKPSPQHRRRCLLKLRDLLVLDRAEAKANNLKNAKSYAWHVPIIPHWLQLPSPLLAVIVVTATGTGPERPPASALPLITHGRMPSPTRSATCLVARSP